MLCEQVVEELAMAFRDPRVELVGPESAAVASSVSSCQRTNDLPSGIVSETATIGTFAALAMAARFFVNESSTCGL